MTVVRVLGLTVAWLALWSDLSPANVVSGLLVALGVVALSGTRRSRGLVVRPLRVARLALYFVYRLVVASVVVARTVIAPRHRVHTGIVAVPLRGCPDALTTLIADAISLTPGTLTIEVRRDPLTLYVHALDLRDVEHVRADIRKLELLAVRAFGTGDALDGLEADDTEAWSSR